MDLKSQIIFMVEQVLLEIRSKFKWEEFKDIEDPHEQEEYLDNTGTQRLGIGSSRRVYLLSNRFVLKLADPDYREAGRAQNRVEVEVSQIPNARKYVTQVYDYDDEYDWIISDLVRPLKSKEEFEKLTGVNFVLFDKTLILLINLHNFDIQKALKYLREQEELSELAGEEERAKMFKQMINLLEENKWLRGLIDFIKESGQSFEIGDIVKMGHWGKTPDGRAVILDYGFTDEIMDEYY